MNTSIKRPAFATLTAIGLIALIAVMFLALGAMLITDGRRTIQQSSDSQLRQMLLAGAAIARERAPAAFRTATTQPISLDLPRDMEARSGTLEIQFLPAATSSLHARVTAKIDGRSMSQMLSFNRENDSWIATEALLEPGIADRPPITQLTTSPTTQTVEPHSPSLR